MTGKWSVSYSGILLKLFKEEQRAVTEGELMRNGVSTLGAALAQRGEKSMPPEIAAALKKQRA